MGPALGPPGGLQLLPEVQEGCQLRLRCHWNTKQGLRVVWLPILPFHLQVQHCYVCRVHQDLPCLEGSGGGAPAREYESHHHCELGT